MHNEKAGRSRQAYAALDPVMNTIGSALTTLQEGRGRLAAQDASIPETLEATMHACELALTAVRACLALLRAQDMCIDAIRDWIDDSRMLQDALAKRLEVLNRT